MTLALRLFVAMFFWLVLIVALTMMLSGLAFAQSAAAPAQPDLFDLVFSTAGAAIGGLVVATWAALKPPPWLKAVADAVTTKEALNWEHLVTSGLDRAEAYARTKYDAAKNSGDYARAMASFLESFNPEIVKWADKNGNGIVDLIETRLPPGSVPKPPAPAAVSPLPRKVTKAEAAGVKH